MMDCDICCNIVTNTLKCLNSACASKICKICTSKYLCESINEPMCMNCKHLFTREYLIQNLGGYWYNGKYKKSRKNVLLDREKALFADTMEFAEKYKKISVLEKKIKEINQEFEKKKKEFRRYKIQTDKTLSKLNVTIYNINYGNNNNVPAEAIDIGGLSNKKTITTTRIYTKCPINNCLGMLNEENQCITCNANVCKQCCEVINNDNHTCDPNAIETMKLLKKDTKNCPSCLTPIHRIEGCYQMWCTNCHTTFHYRTLEILKEKIHNPHYVDWLKNNTKIQTNNINCDEQIGYNSFDQFKKYNRILFNSCLNIYNHMTHIEYNVLADARHNLAHFTDENCKRLKRTQYMLKEISNEKYTTILFKSYKQTQRWNDIIDLVNMYLNVLRNILTNVLITKNLKTLQEELETICKYVNQQSHRINQLYNNYYNMNINIFISPNGEICFN